MEWFSCGCVRNSGYFVTHFGRNEVKRTMNTIRWNFLKFAGVGLGGFAVRRLPGAAAKA
jgi:hypothetical protein